MDLYKVVLHYMVSIPHMLLTLRLSSGGKVCPTSYFQRRALYLRVQNVYSFTYYDNSYANINRTQILLLYYYYVTTFMASMLLSVNAGSSPTCIYKNATVSSITCKQVCAARGSNYSIIYATRPPFISCICSNNSGCSCSRSSSDSLALHRISSKLYAT